jgi:hypothetical protein
VLWFVLPAWRMFLADSVITRAAAVSVRVVLICEINVFALLAGK